MKWSVDGQTPEFLAATRMASLGDHTIALLLDELHLQSGMHVLDCGCGSGEYVFRLGSHTQGVNYTGIDNDEGFTSFAEQRARGAVGYPFEEPNPANAYSFSCANGLALPFEDATFDAVVSHTYLTAVPDWQTALSEMVRVCKPGGSVSSVTSMTDDFYGTGYVSLFKTPFTPDDPELADKIWKARPLAFASVDLTGGISPSAVPAAFAHAGLENVHCVPVGHYFSLSDAALSEADYRRFVELVYRYELDEYERLKDAPAAAGVLTSDDFANYKRCLDERRAELLDSCGDNHEWNWYGNSSLFVCGTVAGA